MALIRLKGVILAMVCVLFFTTLPIAALISVTTLALTGTRLSSFTIFALLLSLMTIRTTFCYNLSMSMQVVADAKVALDRVQYFLEEKVSKYEGNKQPEENDPNQLLTDQNIVMQCKSTNAVKMSVLSTNCRQRNDVSDDNSKSSTSNSPPAVTPIISPSLFPEISSETSVDEGTKRLITSYHPSDSSSIEPYITIFKVSCSWSQDYLTQTLKDINFNACSGDMLAITGEVGSGKSSLLTAIIGELPLYEGTISYHGKVAYVSQIPWVFSGTVRDNILFGLPYNEEKFKFVVHICGLTRDLTELANGDLTEIGQRGATLSGGQKVRVALARAVYSDADIYLFDDPLSAVDAKVRKELFESCIPDYLSGRIRLLVTHQLQYLKDVDRIAVMKNGSIIRQGGYEELTDKGVFSDGLEFQDDTKSADSVSVNYFKEVNIMNDSNENEEETSQKPLGLQQTCDMFDADRQKVCGLREEEETKTAGTVTWAIYWDYFKEGLPVPLIMLLVGLMISAQGKTLNIVCSTL